MSSIIELIQSVSESELRFISNLDYACDNERHYQALRQVIFEQECIGNAGQLWHPAEVYELGSNWLQEGHEREFTICTLLVIHNAIQGSDCYTDLEAKFDNHAWEYDKLPEHLKNVILSAYELANF